MERPPLVLPIMIFLLWMWQEAFSNLSVRTIPYSEFKNHLRAGEVVESVVKTDTIEGKIQPHGSPSTPPGAESRTNAPAAGTSLIFFARFEWRIPAWCRSWRRPMSGSMAPVPV